MILNKKHIALLFSLQQLFVQRLSPRARILEVNIDENNGIDPGILATVRVQFGPTHQLTMNFNGAVNTKEYCLGNSWSLNYNDDEIQTSLTADTQFDEDALVRLKTDLGI